MNKPARTALSLLRGYTVQLLAITVLPLTVLLLLIAFGSVSLHQQDMRALVGERDQRAVNAAAAAIASELHHRMATIAGAAAFASSSDDAGLDRFLSGSGDAATDFDGGLAVLDSGGALIRVTDQDPLWRWIAGNAAELSLASPSGPAAVFSPPFLDPASHRYFVVISAYVPARDRIVAGAFSPEMLARETLSSSYPADSHAVIYLLDSSRRQLFVSEAGASPGISPDQMTDLLGGGSGTLFVRQGQVEHVLACSPIPTTGWVLLTDEAWETAVSPSLQTTQLAPLVLVPVFILALVALWFGAAQIVRPLQRLESKAAALARGDFEAIAEPVGGIAEVRHLQSELTEMARKVQAAQEGLRDYIGAITSAQEDERLRMARELHDDTIQSVIALKQRLQLARKSGGDGAARKSLDELEALAEQTIENLRRLTRALRPIYLEDLGLVTALEMLARETGEANHLAVDFQRVGAESRLPPDAELALYRIAQEALNNIVRHAQAGRAALQVVFEAKEIRLEVSDDGIGFQVPQSPAGFVPNGHYGLLGMHERAELIGARLEVNSDAGGTRISVHMPLPGTN